MNSFHSFILACLVGVAVVAAQNAIGDSCTDGALSGICSDSCAVAGGQGDCNAGLTCCENANLPGIGDGCGGTGPLSHCTFPGVCSSAPLHLGCEDGNECCEKMFLPVENEECGETAPNQGVCLEFFDALVSCAGNTITTGTHCAQGFICCTGPRSEGQPCNVVGASNTGTCSDAADCSNNPQDQGDCDASLVCCLPAEVGEECQDDAMNDGVCADSAGGMCTDASPTQGTCVDGAVCCSAQGLGAGNVCAPGGTCQVGCINPIESYGQQNCSTGLSCCISGLNSECFFYDWHYEYPGHCILKADCRRTEGKEHQGRGSCCGSQFRCCKNPDCSPL